MNPETNLKQTLVDPKPTLNKNLEPLLETPWTKLKETLKQA